MLGVVVIVVLAVVVCVDVGVVVMISAYLTMYNAMRRKFQSTRCVNLKDNDDEVTHDASVLVSQQKPKVFIYMQV